MGLEQRECECSGERERKSERAQCLRDLRAREMTGIHNVAGNGEKTLAYDTAGSEKTLVYDAVGTEMNLAFNGRGAGSGEKTLACNVALGDSVDKTLPYDAVGGEQTLAYDAAGGEKTLAYDAVGGGADSVTGVCVCVRVCEREREREERESCYAGDGVCC